jgi:hypothetical protein
MKTVLDTAYTWFLESASKFGDELRVIVREGSVGDEETLTINKVDLKCNSIDLQEGGKKVRITFSAPIAWQNVDESYSSFDEYEVRDDKASLQVLTKSRYLDYVNANHGWYTDIKEAEGKHYRIWTEDDVIDVVSTEPPKIEEMDT